MLTNAQYEQLLKPLNGSRIAKRSQAGRSLSYLEAWDVKAHLIRIFGFGGWSAEVIGSHMAFEEKNEKAQWNVGYKVVLRLSIPSLNCTYTEAAVGSASLPQRGEAHDMAVKTAESDALKRAAINLGTQFGLSLYNDGATADVVGKTLDRDTPPEGAPAPLVTENSGGVQDNPGAGVWIEEMKASISEGDTINLLAIKQRMNAEGVTDWVYGGVTLAKWLDKAVANVGKASA